jgi:anti-sigma-K factor RskA
MRRTNDEILIRRYFLGDLPQEERARIEDRYLADADVFEGMLATENDLIDAYVRGELSEGERQKFEAAYFTSPERRQKVEFARSLSQVSTLARQSVQVQGISPRKGVWAAFSVQRAIPQWALAAAVVVIVMSATWLMVENQRLRNGLQQAQAGQAELLREEDAQRQQIAELERNPKDQVQENRQGSEVARLEPLSGPDVTLSLTPGTARDTGEPQKTLVLSPAASRVRLQLVLDSDEYKTYEAVLLTAEGKEVARGKALRSRSIDGNAAIAWRLPAHSIHAGDYIVQLAGQLATGSQEDLQPYTFRVLLK